MSFLAFYGQVCQPLLRDKIISASACAQCPIVRISPPIQNGIQESTIMADLASTVCFNPTIFRLIYFPPARPWKHGLPVCYRVDEAGFPNTECNDCCIGLITSGLRGLTGLKLELLAAARSRRVTSAPCSSSSCPKYPASSSQISCAASTSDRGLPFTSESGLPPVSATPHTSAGPSFCSTGIIRIDPSSVLDTDGSGPLDDFALR